VAFFDLDLSRRRPSAAGHPPPPTLRHHRSRRSRARENAGREIGDLFHGARVVFCFPAKMEGIGAKQGGVEYPEGLTEKTIRQGRDSNPGSPIPIDPRGFRPNPCRDGM
jgi:hypothetical protein